MRPRTSPIWKLHKDAFAKLVGESKTITSILSYFGLKNHGRNAHTFHQRVSEDGLDITHLKRYGDAIKGISNKATKPLEQLLVEKATGSRANIKKRLIKEGLLVETCGKCGLGNSWQNESLVLVLDHINGISDDYRTENLRLLCPNCNSQTSTFCGRNNRNVENLCVDCSILLTSRTKRCTDCRMKHRKIPTKRFKVDWPPVAEVKLMVEKTSYVQVGKGLGVTDNAVRRYIKRRIGQ